MNLMPPTCDKHLVIANADLLSERCEFIGMTGTTISHLKKILKIHPELIDFHNKIGISYLLQGKNEESIASFKKTIEHDAENSLALVNLGWAKGKLAEKIQCVQKLWSGSEIWSFMEIFRVVFGQKIEIFKIAQ